MREAPSFLRAKRHSHPDQGEEGPRWAEVGRSRPGRRAFWAARLLGDFAVARRQPEAQGAQPERTPGTARYGQMSHGIGAKMYENADLHADNSRVKIELRQKTR